MDFKIAFINNLYHNRTLKFIISGCMGAATNLISLYILHGIWGIEVVLAASIAFVLSFFVSFSLQKLWTFSDNTRDKLATQAIKYFCVGLFNLCVNAIGIYILVKVFGVWYLLAQAGLSVLIAFFSYFVYSIIFYQKKKHNKISVVIATGIYPPEIGGPSVYVAKLRSGLEEEVDVQIVTYRNKEYDVPDSVVAVSRTSFTCINYIKYFYKLCQETKTSDILYSFDLFSTGIPSYLLKIVRPRVKLVVRLGGDFLWEKAIANSWTEKPLGEYYQQDKNWKENIFIFIQKQVLRKCDKVIFSTAWQRDIYLKAGLVNEEKATVIENSYKLKTVHDVQANDGKVKLLFAGRLLKLKNIDLLLDTLVAHQDLELVVYGEGPYKERLKELVKEKDLSSRVKINNALGQDELLREIRKGKYLVVIPSITDISPNMALDALVCGRPVVVTKYCGYYNHLESPIVYIDPQSKEESIEKIYKYTKDEIYNDLSLQIKGFKLDRSYEELTRDHIKLFAEIL